MEAVQGTEALKCQVEQLRSALTTVTEALILFQEFIESEIGEMSYFRDSGSHSKLVDLYEKMRATTLKVLPQMKQMSTMRQYRHSIESDEEEQVEVDVDYNDDDPIDEITIRQVFSCRRAQDNDSMEKKRRNSAITITPVYSEENKGEQQFGYAQPPVMMNKSSPPQLVPADASFMLVDRQRTIPSMKLDTRENDRNFTGCNSNSSLGSANSFSSVVPMLPVPLALPILQQPQPVVPTQMKQQKLPKKGGLKKSLLRINNSPLKRKYGKTGPGGSKSGGRDNLPNETDRPLNLKKQIRRPSECPVRCDFCGKGYSSKGVMSRHIKERHTNEPQFPCFYCQLKFRNGPSRLEHMNTSHPEDMNSVTCPYCNRKSSSVAGKRNHMMLCAGKHRLVEGDLPLALTKKGPRNMST